MVKIILIYMLSVVCLLATETIEKYLKKVELDMNKVLPQLLDEETRIDSIQVNGLELRYNYTLIKTNIKSFDIEKNKILISKNIYENQCSDIKTLQMLRKKIIYVYHYVDRENNVIFDIKLDSCKTFLEDTCKKNSDNNCVMLGLEYIGVNQDKKATKLFKQACDNNIVKGCSILAEMYFNAKGVPKNNKKAIELYSKACNGNYAIACAQLGLIYVKNKEHKKALNLYSKACKVSNGEVGCSNLGTLYESGKGVDQNYTKALKFYNRACEYSESGMGCSNLGSMYNEGKGVSKDYLKAKGFFEQACERQEPHGCYNLGYIYELLYKKGQGNKESYTQAAFYYDKACKKNFGLGCNNLGVLYLNGLGVKQNKRKAKKLFKKSCQEMTFIGCSNLKALY